LSQLSAAFITIISEVFSGDFSGVMGSADSSVEIFTYTDCGAHYDDALDFLRQRGIEFKF